MPNTQHHPVVVRILLLEKRRQTDTGRRAYGLLILDEHGKIVARPHMSRDIKEVVAFVRRHRREGSIVGRVTFDPPDGVDAEEGRNPRRYQALELSEIFYVSSSLGQS